MAHNDSNVYILETAAIARNHYEIEEAHSYGYSTASGVFKACGVIYYSFTYNGEVINRFMRIEHFGPRTR